MASNTTIHLDAAKAACDAIVDLIDTNGPGKLQIYTTAQPTDPSVAITDQTKLAEITLNNPAFGAAGDGDPGGEATADVDPALQDASIDETGTAAWFRVVDGNDKGIIDGTVGTSDADLIVNTVSFVSGATFTVSSWTFTVPETS